MDESKYYNAVAIALKGSYGKIKKLKDRHVTWKTVLGNIQNAPDPDKEHLQLEKFGVRLILMENPEYPESLKHIPFPPFGLYVLGNVRYDSPAVAVVGTRKPTPLGKDLSGRFSEKLSAAGIPIISGLALGIDAEAHRGALLTSGKTVAVLGTPLDNIYPKQNDQIAREILENDGAVISEFAFGHPYNPANFLARNRIISGLSRGILIIEAPERSGSLATAKFALEQDRDIFVIPGNPESLNYKGSNSLLKSGAILVTDPQDILDHYGINTEENIRNSEELSESDREILEIIRELGESASAEHIIEASGMEVPEINRMLALLTIKGIIKELSGKYSINS